MCLSNYYKAHRSLKDTDWMLALPIHTSVLLVLLAKPPIPILCDVQNCSSLLSCHSCTYFNRNKCVSGRHSSESVDKDNIRFPTSSVVQLWAGEHHLIRCIMNNSPSDKQVFDNDNICTTISLKSVWALQHYVGRGRIQYVVQCAQTIVIRSNYTPVLDKDFYSCLLYTSDAADE